MARFSERTGISKPPQSIQLESMNDELRNSLWNVILNRFDGSKQLFWNEVARVIAQGFRKVPADEMPDTPRENRKWTKDYFFDLPWHGVYDLVEFLVDHVNVIQHPPSDVYAHHDEQPDFQNVINFVLERELSGYRFISGVLAPITSPVEMQAIEDTVESSYQVGLQGVHQHLHSALTLLGKKPEPDYRNSIKESISAVESAAKQIARDTSRGLDTALEKLSRSAELHGALKSAFKSLYGFTSDDDGIRHAILTQPTVGYDEAKFMLVACSAF